MPDMMTAYFAIDRQTMENGCAYLTRVRPCFGCGSNARVPAQASSCSEDQTILVGLITLPLGMTSCVFGLCASRCDC